MEDKVYVEARNKLIPHAEKAAYKAAGKRPPEDGPERDGWVLTWNLTFHTTMDTLARQAGLI